MMVRTSSAALAVALAVVLAGCATPPPADPNAEPYEAKEYRTGSNIPVRDRTASGEVTAVKPDATTQRPFGLSPAGTPARP